MRLTHYGWWLFCPVKIGDLDTDCPTLVPRWFWCAPLYWLAHQLQSVIIGLNSMVFEDYEPAWYFAVTGEIEQP